MFRSGLLPSFVSRKALPLLILLPALAGQGVRAQAQMAHFSYSQSPVAGGLSNPQGVAVDTSGNVYIAELGNNRVLKETPSAGSYTGSIVLGGLTYANGVAVDAAGNVYIADAGQTGILKETLTSGTYSSNPAHIGTGFDPVAVAVDSSGNLYATEDLTGSLYKETLTAGSYAQTSASVAVPKGVALDSSGNIYVAEVQNGQVVKGTLASGVYSESPVVQGLNFPTGVAVDSSGNVYVVDQGADTVYRETPPQGTGTYTQSVVASGLSAPFGIAVDANGALYVSDAYAGGRVLKLLLRAVNLGTQGVGSTSPSQTLTFTFDSAGTLGSYAVLTQGAAGLDFTDAGGGSCQAGTAYSSGASCTVNVSFAPRYAGARYGAVTLYNTAGAPIATAYLSGTGTGPQMAFSPSTQTFIGSGTDFPLGVAVDGGGNVYIADTYHNQVLKGQTAVVTGLSSPYSVAVDGGGNLYIADTYYHPTASSPYGRVLKETLLSTGSYTQSTIADGTTSPYPMDYPNAVAVDGNGNVYIANTDANQVLEERPLSTGGYTQSLVADATSTPNALNFPKGVAVDGSGNVYVANTMGYQVLKETLSAPGIYTQSLVAMLTSGGYDSPFGVAVDGSGNVYYTDAADNQVIAAVPASNGTYTQTRAWTVSEPYGIAVDSGGNVLATNATSNNVSRLDIVDAPSLFFAATRVGSTSLDSPQAVTVTNIGNQALTFPPPVNAGAFNPGVSTNFTYGPSSTCTQTGAGAASFMLAAGQSCTELLSFTPQAAGTISGSVVNTDDNLNLANATQSISVNGAATAGTVTMNIAPVSVPYGTQNTSVTATVTYGGSAPTGPVTITLNGDPNSQQTAACSVSSGTRTCTTTYNLSSFLPGSYNIAASEAADGNYSAASGTGSLTITQATPSVTIAPQAIVYGAAQAALAANIAYTGSTAPQGGVTIALDNGAAMIASCAGASSPLSCTVIVATSALSVGNHAVTAVEAADIDYTSATGTGLLNVTRATPSVIIAPQSIVYGTAQAVLQANIVYTGSAAPSGGVTVAVDNGAAMTAGCSGISSPLSCAAAVATSTLGAGSHTVTAVAAADINYTSAFGTGVLTVTRATPVITWAQPAAVAVGTPLSGAQLNATANVAGTFAYVPAAGTILVAGSQILSATFSPSDATDYTTASQQVTLPVLPYAATPIFTPGTGAYTAAQNVMITDATANATIYYTTDGSTPTTTSSRYAAPIPVPSSETIQAIATAPGYETSAIDTAMVTIYKPPVCTLTVQGTSTAGGVTAVVSCTDPQGQALTSTLSWGDGATTPATQGRNAHTYANAGTYTVVLTSTNTSGLQGSAQQQITPNQTPICSLGIVQGTAAIYAVSVTATCTDPQGQPLTLLIDWGDGSQSPATNNAVNTHAYSNPSASSATPYIVDLTAVDTSGLSGSTVQPVTILPAATQAAPGGTSQVAVSAPSQSSTPPETQVSFICTSVSTAVNGQTVTNALPSQYGITCSAPTVSASSAQNQVTVNIQTTSASTTTSARDTGGTTDFYYAMALPLPTLASFVMGLMLPGFSGRRRKQAAAMGMIVLACFALSSCGGSFTPPPVIPTPVGTYYITIVEVSVTTPSPSGFVQTSLIVPLPIGVAGS